MRGDENGRPALLVEPVQLIPVVASGRLIQEKDHLTLIRALVLCRNRRRISLTIAGAGPMERRLKAEASRQLNSMPVSIGFHQSVTMQRKITSWTPPSGPLPIWPCKAVSDQEPDTGIGPDPA